MQITNYELFAVPPRWLLLKLETNDGTVGWGEPIIQGRLDTVKTAVSELVEGYLLGADPRRIEYHWRKLYQSGYFRGGPILMSALSGIDQALWDIKGRHHDVPIYELLGGHVRDRMLVYHWLGIVHDDPETIADSAREAADHGYQAFKINLVGEFRPVETPAVVDHAAERFRAVRESVGDDAYVGADFHGRVSKPMAVELIERLEPYDPMFIDQPLLPEHADSFERISEQTAVPLATGERFYSRYDFKPLLVDDVVSIVQPDITNVGGISELRRVATLAETFDASVIPHCPLGPVALAACLQVGFATQNVIMQEQSLGLHDTEASRGLEYVDDPEVFQFEDGYVERLDGPGLGIEVDEAYVREQSRGEVNWHNPVWHHEDGSLAEW